VAGDHESVNHIKSYLSEIPEKLKRPPPPRPLPQVAPPDHAEPPPEHKFIANFPRPTVEGIRKVPFWTHVTGLAFVRYKKPQPYNLSRTIRQLLLQKQKRVDYQHLLSDYYIPLADHEDAWEDILRVNLGVGSGEGTFGAPMRDYLDDVGKAFRESQKKAVETATVMADIVEKEKELALKEKEERRRIAWEKRQAKRTGLMMDKRDALSELEGSL
jgi:hypothetical protein